MTKRFVGILLAACVACVEWARLSGTVKGINLKDQTVTIENREGDLLLVPIDWQVRIKEKNDDLVGLGLKDLKLGEKITLTRTPQEKPVDDTPAFSAPEPSQRGQ